MINSTYFLVPTFLLILSNSANSSIVTPASALSRINLPSVLSPHTSCRYHLMYNNISTSDLSTTRNVPLTLTKRIFPESLEQTLVNPSLKLEILQNKGWLCQIVILFVTSNSSNFTPSHQKALGFWILAQIRDYFKISKNISVAVYPDNLYFILIPSKSEILLSSVNAPFYLTPSFSQDRQLPVKFSIVLFLTANRVQLWRQKSLGSVPSL